MYWTKDHETRCQQLIAEGCHGEAVEMTRVIVRGFLDRYGRALNDDDRADIEARVAHSLWRAFAAGRFDPKRGRVFSLATKATRNALANHLERMARLVSVEAPMVSTGLTPWRVLAARRSLEAVERSHALAGEIVEAMERGAAANARGLAARLGRRVRDIEAALEAMRKVVNQHERMVT